MRPTASTCCCMSVRLTSLTGCYYFRCAATVHVPGKLKPVFSSQFPWVYHSGGGAGALCCGGVTGSSLPVQSRSSLTFFFRECELEGKIFFNDGSCVANTDSKTKRQSLQMYTDLRMEKVAANPRFATADIADLTQRPPFGSLDVMVPTLIASPSGSS